MREFYIQDDGIRLHAKLDIPEGVSEESGKCPLCIVIHGLTGHMEETHIIGASKALNEEGIATLRVEMYGHGRSGGAFENHNLFRWLNNAMTVVDYAKTLDFVTDMYICGHSQGGVTTIMLAGMMPDVFRAAIPLSPGVMITEGSRTGRLLRGSFDPDHVPDEMWVNDEQKVKGNYIRAAQMLDVDWSIRHYKNPVLIVHGDEDEAIPVEYAREAAAKYSDAKLVIIPGDDHCYNRHLDQVTAAVREFMLSVMQIRQV